MAGAPTRGHESRPRCGTSCRTSSGQRQVAPLAGHHHLSCVRTSWLVSVTSPAGMPLRGCPMRSSDEVRPIGTSSRPCGRRRSAAVEALQDELAGAGGVGLARAWPSSPRRPGRRRRPSCRNGSCPRPPGWPRSPRRSTASSAASSLTTARPRAATISSGEPSPASTPSSTCRASLSFSAPDATSSLDPGHLGRGHRQRGELGTRLVGPAGQLAEPPLAAPAAGDAPAATVSATRSSAPAFRNAAMSRSDRPHSRLQPGPAGRGKLGQRGPQLAPPTRRDGATGTRSGSGKYR